MVRWRKYFPWSLEDAINRHNRKVSGHELLGFYLTMGKYDEVLIVEGPSDEVAATIALSSGSQGNVCTETLKAFPEAEYRQIIANIP